MPVRQVGQDCYQWGNQKVYCGTDAKRKAILQGIAIENTGWREAEDARDFAREKHEGQMYGDKPYMTHVEDVASGFEDTHLREIAYLHDVVEDSDVTIQEIRERFGEKVSVAVDALTRRKEPYFDYIRRVKENPEATQIKLADLHANLKNNPKESLAKRYHKAIGILTNKKEAEEIDVTTLAFPFKLPPQLNKNNDFLIHEGYLLISTDRVGKYRIWDMDVQDFLGWNIIGKGNPIYDSYEDKYSLTHPEVEQFDSVQDALLYAEWRANRKIEAVKNFFNPEHTDYQDAQTGLSLATPAKRAALSMKMTKADLKSARHPNRSAGWIPLRIKEEWAKELTKKMPCPTCGEKIFTSLIAAQRHHFYCEKYGAQPQNKLYFTPFEIILIQEGVINQPKEAEMIDSSNIFYLFGGVTLGILIPYILDSRANKV